MERELLGRNVTRNGLENVEEMAREAREMSGNLDLNLSSVKATGEGTIVKVLEMAPVRYDVQTVISKVMRHRRLGGFL